jgi:hypothetical protein
MVRLSTIVGLVLLLLVPTDAAALWLDGQCATAMDPMWSEFSPPSAADDTDTTDVVEEESGGCDDNADDPSSNVCFEAAEHPISTLPELLAQTQAERVTAALVEQAVDAVAARIDAVEPSPSDTSLEDPNSPGRALAERPSMPRPPSMPSSCSAAQAPDNCHNAPPIPTLNLEVSVAQAHSSTFDLSINPAPRAQGRRGPPNTGLAPATGVRSRVERPPQMA